MENIGRIYKLYSDVCPDLVYYGSTRTSLKTRWYNHRGIYRAYLNGTAKRVSAFEIIERDPEYFQLDLVEECPVEHLKQREAYYITNFKCVNHNVPGRTHLEAVRCYYNKNKDKILSQRKEYYQKNKEKIKANNTLYSKEKIDKYREYQRKYQIKYRAKMKEKKIAVKEMVNIVKNI